MNTTAQEFIQLVIERLQMDIDSGDRPDQWSMEAMQQNLKAALEKIDTAIGALK